MMQRRMLSKEDEATGAEDEVRREDQDKINKFSRLHQRETALEEELKLKIVRLYHPANLGGLCLQFDVLLYYIMLTYCDSAERERRPRRCLQRA